MPAWFVWRKTPAGIQPGVVYSHLTDSEKKAAAFIKELDNDDFEAVKAASKGGTSHILHVLVGRYPPPESW